MSLVRHSPIGVLIAAGLLFAGKNTVIVALVVLGVLAVLLTVRATALRRSVR
ncbi:hypothetical protein [Actinocrispum sp. NPDC049592]|uniref:hypothetical protein n=1 Tax=Actinocrispum sp. NPDC049592 TaxID=3154835 RepID=UPI00342C5D11